MSNSISCLVCLILFYYFMSNSNNIIFVTLDEKWLNKIVWNNTVISFLPSHHSPPIYTILLRTSAFSNSAFPERSFFSGTIRIRNEPSSTVFHEIGGSLAVRRYYSRLLVTVTTHHQVDRILVCLELQQKRMDAMKNVASVVEFLPMLVNVTHIEILSGFLCLSQLHV